MLCGLVLSSVQFHDQPAAGQGLVDNARGGIAFTPHSPERFAQMCPSLVCILCVCTISLIYSSDKNQIV